MSARSRKAAKKGAPAARSPLTARTTQDVAADDRAPRPVDSADLQSVEALDAGLGGRWLVTTRRSQHIWDLDAMTYQRLPGAGGNRFEHDGGVHAITSVQSYPAVGSCSYVFFEDPDRPWMEQWRISSTIASITRLDGEGLATTLAPAGDDKPDDAV